MGEGDSLAEIETIKTLLELPSPVSGTVVEVNPALVMTPEVINQDPYGDGWLAVVETTDWNVERLTLLEADAYFSAMQSEAHEELRKP